MAASGDADDSVKSTLRAYKERAETADALKLTPFLKCLEACGLKQYKKIAETSIWNLHSDKAKKCTMAQITSKVIPDIAADAVGTKKGLKGRAPHDDPDVIKMVDDIKSKLAAKAGQSAHQTAKVDKTTSRLTDTSQYTGASKERFDKDGKGKGIDGRVEKADTSGYVGNYKNAGTYDK